MLFDQHTPKIVKKEVEDLYELGSREITHNLNGGCNFSGVCGTIFHSLDDAIQETKNLPRKKGLRGEEPKLFFWAGGYLEIW